LHGGYAASKWAAEALLDGAAAIHRLGLLPGAPDSSWDAFVRGLAALGAVPEGRHAALRFDLTPADRAAEAVAALLRRDDGPRVWHHHSPRGATLAELLAALHDEGVAVEVVAPDRFAARVRERRSVDGARALLSLSRRLHGEPRRADLDLFLLSEHHVVRARSEAASGVAIPVADLRAAVRRALEPR
jgi:thioester reductase-like protein